MDENTVNNRDEQDPSKSSRRNFLKNIGLLGAGVAAGAGALYSGDIFEKKKAATGESKVLLTQDNKLVEVDSLEMKVLEKNPVKLMLEKGREGIAGKRWVLATDLSKCRNARRCIPACQEAHQLRPEQYHMNTLQMQDSPKTAPSAAPRMKRWPLRIRSGKNCRKNEINSNRMCMPSTSASVAITTRL